MTYTFDPTSLLDWGNGQKLAPIRLGAEQINKMLETGEVSGVALDPHRGIEPSFDAILEKIPGARVISVSNVREFIPKLTRIAPSLEEIAMPEKELLFSLELLPNLRKLRARWSERGLLGSENCPIEDLSVWAYRSKENDLGEMPPLSHLKRLKLIQSRMKTLHGINKYDKLISFELYKCSILELMNGIQLKELKYFTAESC